MTIGFNVQDADALYGILADFGGDIVVKTDHAGFIEHASSGLERLGFSVSEMLIAPHLADLTDALHAELVRTYHRHAMQSGPQVDRLEFPLYPSVGAPRWYSLSLRPLVTDRPPNSSARSSGAVGVLRCVDQERMLESQLLETALTDPLTRIANRQAFLGMVGRCLAQGSSGALALFEIDRMRAIRLRFGQRAGDEVIGAFAGFLRNILPKGHILARLEDNRFGVMMPELQQRLATDLVSEILVTFAEISRDAELEEMRLTASASVTTLEESLDDTLARGEVALTLARSAGGHRVEIGDAIHDSWRRSRSA